MGLPLICQDTVSDVGDGQTYRPRSLGPILHDVKCSKSAETLTFFIPNSRGINRERCKYFSIFPTL